MTHLHADTDSLSGLKFKQNHSSKQRQQNRCIIPAYDPPYLKLMDDRMSDYIENSTLITTVMHTSKVSRISHTWQTSGIVMTNHSSTDNDVLFFCQTRFTQAYRDLEAKTRTDSTTEHNLRSYCS